MISDSQIQRQLKIESRVINEAHWYLDNKSSVRDVADNFMVCKSTVHKDFRDRLKHIDHDLYDEVDHLLNYNRNNAVNKMNRANEIRRALNR